MRALARRVGIPLLETGATMPYGRRVWGTRTTHRPRRVVPRPVLLLAKPFFRYSVSRDAFVLRGIGHRIGPVLRSRNSSSYYRYG